MRSLASGLQRDCNLNFAVQRQPGALPESSRWSSDHWIPVILFRTPFRACPNRVSARPRRSPRLKGEPLFRANHRRGAKDAEVALTKPLFRQALQGAGGDLHKYPEVSSRYIGIRPPATFFQPFRVELSIRRLNRNRLKTTSIRNRTLSASVCFAQLVIIRGQTFFRMY